MTNRKSESDCDRSSLHQTFVRCASGERRDSTDFIIVDLNEEDVTSSATKPEDGNLPDRTTDVSPIPLEVTVNENLRRSIQPGVRRAESVLRRNVSEVDLSVKRVSTIGSSAESIGERSNHVKVFNELKERLEKQSSKVSKQPSLESYQAVVKSNSEHEKTTGIATQTPETGNRKRSHAYENSSHAEAAPESTPRREKPRRHRQAVYCPPDWSEFETTLEMGGSPKKESTGSVRAENRSKREEVSAKKVNEFLQNLCGICHHPVPVFQSFTVELAGNFYHKRCLLDLFWTTEELRFALKSRNEEITPIRRLTGKKRSKYQKITSKIKNIFKRN